MTGCQRLYRGGDGTGRRAQLDTGGLLCQGSRSPRHRHLDLCDVGFVILTHRLGVLQVEFADGARDLVTVVADPAQQGIVSLLKALIRASVNSTRYGRGGQLVYPNIACWGYGLSEKDSGFAIHIGFAELGIVPHGETRRLSNYAGPYTGNYPRIKGANRGVVRDRLPHGCHPLFRQLFEYHFL